ncbi:hypothetical protein DAPPUDRAFT_335572 [Daphnia pulex]|uniref:Uncharacterized protein n=1 Tax=Daphnia pulex TaxID=6669 RepID=E9HY18_DAPPU|nr:hypothetical protein DAPPUDRAFT_335572 [Daphnia pulex]|eukprot:EFX63363.1 hypothetical protein DAPPUDRAFT_335572 [Daphnia pulex]
MTNELHLIFKIVEQVVQQQIAEMQATWQDPTDAWGDDSAQLNISPLQHPAIAEEVKPEEGPEEEEIVSAEAEGGYPLENKISFSSVDYTYQQQGMSAEEEDEFPGPTESAPLPPPPPPIAAPVVESSPVPAAGGQTNRIIGYCRAVTPRRMRS